MAPRMTTSPVWCGVPCEVFASCCCVLAMNLSAPWSTVLSVCLLRFEGVRHVLWPDPFVELFRGQEAQLQSGIPECEFLAIGLERNLRCFLITDVRIERRHQHKRVVEVFADALFVWLDSCSAAIIK